MDQTQSCCGWSGVKGLSMRSLYTRRKWILNRKSIQLVLGWISRDCVKKPWNGVQIEHMYILHCILHPFIRFSQRAVANSLLLIDLVILRCFLKQQCFLKCDPTETHLGAINKNSDSPNPSRFSKPEFFAEFYADSTGCKNCNFWHRLW